MSVHASTNKWSFDASTVLQPSTAAAVTASAASADFVALDVLTSYWATGDIAQGLDVGVVIEVTAVAGTNPTAAFTVQVAPDSGAFSAPVTIGESLTATATGRQVIVIDRDDLVNALGANSTVGSLRVYATVGGTSPSFTYQAWVAPLPGL